MNNILGAHVEYCWIDMPLDTRETDMPCLASRVARLESLVAQLAAAGPGSYPDDDAFTLELSDDDDCE